MRLLTRVPFRIRPIPLLATLVVVAIGMALGNWQTRRADEKLALEQAIAERSQLPAIDAASVRPRQAPEEFRRIVAVGHFLADWPIYVENRPHGTQSGFHLLMPLRIANTDQVVLVARGWFARDPADRSRIPAVPVPAGSQRIEGMARAHASRVMQLGDKPALKAGAIVQNVDLREFAASSGLPVQPYLIEQHNDTGDGLVRDWPLPTAGVDKHRGYAFQWYALAAMALLFFIVTGIRHGIKPSEAA